MGWSGGRAYAKRPFRSLILFSEYGDNRPPGLYYPIVPGESVLNTIYDVIRLLVNFAPFREESHRAEAHEAIDTAEAHEAIDTAEKATETADALTETGTPDA